MEPLQGSTKGEEPGGTLLPQNLVKHWKILRIGPVPPQRTPECICLLLGISSN